MSDESTPTPEKPVEKPASSPKKGKGVVNPYSWGTGRRKASVARVRIREGDGKFVINRREFDKYFLLEKDRQSVMIALEVTDTTKTTDVFVNVVGGGVTGQAGAVLLGLARALGKANPDCLPKLREHNLLRRDPRRVERKKPGQPGARRRFQFSKR